MMVLHIVTQLLLLHFIAATSSQFMPPSFPYPYPHQGQPMQMMPMAHSQQMMQMPNGGPMQMPNPPPMMPHMPRLPGMHPAQMPFPMTLPMHGGRLPMVVMPHYSKKADKSRKRKERNRKSKRKRINMDSSSSEGSCSESDVEYRARNSLRSSSKKKRHEVLTPVVSYVTKDGYVVYQKKIKKDKAKDWLELTKGDSGEFKENIRLKKREE